MRKHTKNDAELALNEASCARFLRRISSTLSVIESRLRSNSSEELTIKLAELETMIDFLPRKAAGLLSDEETEKVRDNIASTITKISNCEHSDDPNSLRSCIVT